MRKLYHCLKYWNLYDSICFKDNSDIFEPGCKWLIGMKIFGVGAVLSKNSEPVTTKTSIIYTQKYQLSFNEYSCSQSL